MRPPGLHFGFPYGIDRITRVKPSEPKQVGVRASLVDRALGRETTALQAECLTGDRNLILVPAIVQYQIRDEEAFRDVHNAPADRQRAIGEADGYAKRELPRAQGQARKLRYEAEAYCDRVVKEARSKADSFRKVAAEFADSRELTTRRLILEAMEDVLPRLNKVILGDKMSESLDLGLTKFEPDTSRANSAQLDVELVFKDHKQRQTMRLRPEGTGWVITLIETAQRVESPIAYGTPVYEAQPEPSSP